MLFKEVCGGDRPGATLMGHRAAEPYDAVAGVRGQHLRPLDRVRAMGGGERREKQAVRSGANSGPTRGKKGGKGAPSASPLLLQHPSTDPL